MRISDWSSDVCSSDLLKVWGRARLVDIAEDADLVARLHDPAYKARPERAVLIAVAALDWNCQQHLPPRYTLEELEPAFAQVRQEIGRASGGERVGQYG